jgi:hypothetical protein
MLNYKTGKLPIHFIYSGIGLFAIGIWRMVVLDWKGIIFFIISLLFLFIRSGIMIDTYNRKLKKYIDFIVFKQGKWESIESIINLKIVQTKETQGMSVLSITRTETTDVYKLLMTLSNRTIELMSGEKDFIINSAEKIASSLHVSVDNEAP